MLHLTAMICVAIAVAMVMTPAAYHRQVLRDAVSAFFIDFSSWCVLLSMLPLLLGMTLDMYLIAELILDSAARALGVSLCLAALYVVLWFVLPRLLRPERNFRVLPRRQGFK